MLKMIRTAALSAFVGLTALTGMAATAQADGLYLNFGGKADTRVGVYVGDEGPCTCRASLGPRPLES